MTIEEVAEKLAEATGELRGARQELHEERRWRKILVRVLIGMSAFIVVVLVAVGAATVVLLDVAHDNQRNGDLLVECTTAAPEGERHECFERGQEQTAGAVRSIDVNVRCAFQEALNQTLDRLDADIEHVELINPAECFRE